MSLRALAKQSRVCLIVLVIAIWPVSLPSASQAETVDPAQIRVEVTLAKDQKREADAIRSEFFRLSVRNLNFQYLRAGTPPANIVIGSGIPAPIARLAIETALKYNPRGIRFLLLQDLVPPRLIAIHTSLFDETVQVPVPPEGVERLRDPALTTEQFRAVYRELTARGKERR